MNVFKKAYCRIFQKIMYLLIPFFPYREPELLDTSNDILKVLNNKKINNIMLVTDKGIRNLGLTKELETVLLENNIKLTVYDKTLPNPTSDNVEEARSLYLENNCNGLIAFGGGSVMDCAKAVGARIVCPKKQLKKMQGLIKIRKKLPLLIAVPTTAGTGSETTVAAVIVDSQTQHKYVINDFNLIPHFALLDPKVTTTLPKHITSTTGMDALTHAVEAYIGKSRTKKTKKASIEAVKLIFENLEIAYNEGTNLTARKNMLYAAYLAGTAFTKSYVGYVHAVAHTLGGKYHTPHGLANAVILPYVLKEYKSKVYKPLADLAKFTKIVDENVSTKEAAETFISHIEKMNERMQIPSTLDCIKKEDITYMAKLANKEGNPLYPVPVLWDAKELEKIYILISEK